MSGKPEVVVERDGEGYLARVKGAENLYAFGLTRDQALFELFGVIDMATDFQVSEK